MKIKVLYFAALREALGSPGETIELPENATTLAAVRALIAGRGGDWDKLAQMKNLRAAVNQRMAEPDAAVADGDEVAFFPPVTGG
ncbi:MAG: molybdopterin converting factor subunit 1 [Methyloversatilis discipulorum]|jgi:molybdopterin synthase sulfur carrier subunit|uniref:molybdopterin converting factor subunit 1 n=1 Tax=Methyloversatilis discipulorum TaxID=1119528 RepID=UPI0026EE5EE4|nr:molybdopterin converting factor subunit 1 [Methyloversatilis discipulorum]MBV5286880.1 molybdopterin converting factor subunit 1 [Methyloversatilis discipulorum]